MISRYGYHEGAARVMMSVTDDADPDFLNRAKISDFWGLFDPDPIGGVIVEKALIHVGCAKPGRCGHAVKSIVNQALKTYGLLACPIKKGNEKAVKLAVGLGFSFQAEHNGYVWYGRYA